MELKNKKEHHQLYEVWGDIIAIKPLIISLSLSILFGLTFFIFAPDDDSIKLMVGIAGIVIATILNSFLFKPKRNINVMNVTEEDRV